MGPRGTREEIMNPVPKARAPEKVPRARSPHRWATLPERRATPAVEGSLRTCRRQRPVSPLAGNGWVRARGSPEPRHQDRGQVSRGRSRAEPNTQGPGRSGESSPPGRGQAERGTLAATCCWIFPSSVTTQCVVAKAPRAATLSKADRLRNQPGLEHGGSSHRPRTPTATAILPPPARGLAPEAEVSPCRSPSWGGRR